ncbi:MAG: hypothetical protein ABIK60_03005 [candidate division WOR-3 bacterium]
MRITLSSIKKQLQEIYEEMANWNGSKGPFTSKEIRRRELILLKQNFLYQLEEAIKKKSKEKIKFLMEVLKIIDKEL